jgi:predicted dehydrogenase
MKQIVQSIKNGEILVIDAPVPDLLPGCVLVQNAASLVSAGTERHAVEFSQKNLLQKAKARPDLVKQFMDKAKRDGVISAFDAVKTRLDQPLPLGYSTAGFIMAVGQGVTEYRIEEEVACAGVGYANHAEIVCVPKNLVAKVPENVDLESAAFSTLGAIAMQGIRLAEVKVGDIVAVIGLGLLGQLTVQILKAAGCVVLGMDINGDRAALAKESGADWVSMSGDDFDKMCKYFTSDKGVDAVLITAAAKTNEPIELAGLISRDRAIVVAVGLVNLEIPRRTFYEKELDFRISRSYGPGRYDPNYEEKGQDYPIGYVRWTEQRNMQSFLKLMAEGKVDVNKIISHRFKVNEAVKAYDLISGKTNEPYLGIIITYDTDKLHESKIEMKEAARKSVDDRVPIAQSDSMLNIGLLGCGNFPTSTLLPAIKAAKSENLRFIGAYDPVSNNCRHVADKYGFKYCTGKVAEIIDDKNVNVLVVATRHKFHSEQVIAGLNARKHVFCEKPLCLNDSELSKIIKVYNSLSPTSPDPQVPVPLLMVGYNRRFSPAARKLKDFISSSGSKEAIVMNYRVNAGLIPLGHWTQDLEQGGGRIIGEVCHFVDLMLYLAGSSLKSVSAKALPNQGKYSDDNVVITLEFENGALGSIIYLANGDKSFSKERIEVYRGGAVGVIDDFRYLELVRNGRRKITKSLLRQDKGHKNEWIEFIKAVAAAKQPPIPFSEIMAVSKTTFAIIESIKSGYTIKI